MSDDGSSFVAGVFLVCFACAMIFLCTIISGQSEKVCIEAKAKGYKLEQCGDGNE